MARRTSVITVCLLVIGACQIVAESPCRYEEEWKTCGDHLTCDNVLEYKKGDICFRGCFCKGKQIRNRKGDCVPLHECDKPSEECPKNERSTRCGGNVFCHDTCGKTNHVCPQSCVPGCICNPGYLRKYTGGECIPLNKCPDYHRSGITTYHYRPIPESAISGRTNTHDFGVTPHALLQPTIQESKNRTRRDVPCQRNEIYSDCGGNPRCEDFCNNDKIIVCPEVCRSGCVCKEGYIRKVKGGACIPENKCPDVHRCPKNEIYASCGGNQRCEDYCNRKTPISCPLVCYDGCTCKEGYIRNVPGGVCIPKHQCPKGSSGNSERGLRKRRDGSRISRYHPYRPYVLADDPECGDGEEWRTCGFPLTCGNVFTSRAERCFRGCFCKPGYLRNKNGICIPLVECPKDDEGKKSDLDVPFRDRTKRCGPNEVYEECGNSCILNCFNYEIIKNFNCGMVCSSGCFCKKGFIRHPDGECIRPEDCPKDLTKFRKKVCGPGEEYDSCGSMCPPVTCETYGSSIGRSCGLACKGGCFCQRGLIRNARGQCVSPEECPKDSRSSRYSDRGLRKRRDEECGPGEEYDSCGPCKPTTCETYGSTIGGSCDAACKGGCFCRRGLIRNSQGQCVRPEECPKDSKKFSSRDPWFYKDDSRTFRPQDPGFYTKDDRNFRGIGLSSDGRIGGSVGA